MRITLALLFGFLFASSSFAEAPAVPEFLSYGEVMMLTPQKRIQYLADVTEVLILLEKHQSKYEIADADLKSLKEMVADLMREVQFMPEASAGPDVSVIRPSFSFQNKYICSPAGLVRFDEQVGTCVVLEADKVDWKANDCPPGTHSAQMKYPAPQASPHVCIPQASYDQLPDEAKINLDYWGTPSKTDFSSASKEEMMAAVEANPPAKDAKPEVAASGTPAVKPASAAEIAACKPAKADACPTLSEDDRRKAITAYTNVAGHNECIVGGFFSKYEGGKYARGKCEPTHAFPDMGSGFKCKTNEHMCNPVPFCYGYNTAAADKPANVKIGPLCMKVTQNFTADCDAKFRSLTGPGGPKVKTKEFKDPQPLVKCDPSAIKGLKFQDKYNDLIKSTKDSYERLCVKTPEFTAAFCNECQVIGSHISVAACKAEGPEPSAAPANPAAGGKDAKAAPKPVPRPKPKPGAKEPPPPADVETGK